MGGDEFMKLKIYMWFGVGLIAFLLTGCAGTSGVNANVRVAAASYLNPSDSGEASPVTLTFYELKSLAAFKQADYFDLDSSAASVLNSDLIDKQSIEVRPGEVVKHSLLLSEGVKYVGITAGYRNIDQSVWRATVPVVDKKSHLGKLKAWKKQKKINIYIHLQSQQLIASLKN